MSGETGVAYCTNLYFNSVLRILNMLQCCINIECHHQARCEPQWVVRLSSRLYDGGLCLVNLLRVKDTMKCSFFLQLNGSWDIELTVMLLSQSKYMVSFLLLHTLHHFYLIYLFRNCELQQTALSKGCLKDLNQLHWFTHRQPGLEL